MNIAVRDGRIFTRLCARGPPVPATSTAVVDATARSRFAEFPEIGGFIITRNLATECLWGAGGARDSPGGCSIRFATT